MDASTIGMIIGLLCCCLLLVVSSIGVYRSNSGNVDETNSSDASSSSRSTAFDTITNAAAVVTEFCTGPDEWINPLNNQCMQGKCVVKGACRDANTVPRTKTDDNKYVCDYSKCIADFCTGAGERLGTNDGKCYVGTCEPRGVCTNAAAIPRKENAEGKWVCDYSGCVSGLLGTQCNLDGTCQPGNSCSEGKCFATCDPKQVGGGLLNVDKCGPIPHDKTTFTCDYEKWQSTCNELGKQGGACYMNNTCLEGSQCINGKCQ